MENTAPAASPLDIPVMPQCSHCRFPLSGSASGLRHYGTHTAHQESECLRMLHTEIERLRHALLDTARRVEALKRECGMDPESRQAIRNSEYMSIALNARAALLLHNAEVKGDTKWHPNNQHRLQSTFRLPC